MNSRSIKFSSELPHLGGLWETEVKSLKFNLKQVAGVYVLSN